MFGVLISKRLATLKDLETYYSLEDVFNLIEIVQVDNYNEWLAHSKTK